MAWRRNKKLPAPDAVAANGDATQRPEYAEGVLDANAGVPHPFAESGDAGRQPVARLRLYFAKAAENIRPAFERASAGLGVFEGLHRDLARRVATGRAHGAAAAHFLAGLPRGRERWLARWRFSVLVVGVGVPAAFEVFLTSLSVQYLNVPPEAQRFVAVGIAAALVLVALVAANGTAEEMPHLRRLAVGVTAVLVAGLALMRWGVTPNASWLEESGALGVMAVAAVGFVIWTAFLKRLVGRATDEHEQWRTWTKAEHDVCAWQEELDLALEMQTRLPAELQYQADRGVSELRAMKTDFVAACAAWWAGYQATNPAASPDIREQAAALDAALKDVVDAAVEFIEARASGLREEALEALKRDVLVPAIEGSVT